MGKKKQRKNPPAVPTSSAMERLDGGPQEMAAMEYMPQSEERPEPKERKKGRSGLTPAKDMMSKVPRSQRKARRGSPSPSAQTAEERRLANALPQKRDASRPGVTIAKLAEALGQHRITVDSWVRSGLLTVFRGDANLLKIPLDEVAALLALPTINLTLADVGLDHAEETATPPAANGEGGPPPDPNGSGTPPGQDSGNNQ